MISFSTFLPVFIVMTSTKGGRLGSGKIKSEVFIGGTLLFYYPWFIINLSCSGSEFSITNMLNLVCAFNAQPVQVKILGFIDNIH